MKKRALRLTGGIIPQVLPPEPPPLFSPGPRRLEIYGRKYKHYVLLIDTPTWPGKAIASGVGEILPRRRMEDERAEFILMSRAATLYRALEAAVECIEGFQDAPLAALNPAGVDRLILACRAELAAARGEKTNAQ